MMVTLLLACVAAVGTAQATLCRSTCADELRACRHACGGLAQQERHRCVHGCRDQSTCTAPGNRFRTVAYVDVECRQDAQGAFSLKERLVARRGNCDPVTLMDLPPVGPVADPLGICRLYAGFHGGTGSVGVGLIQRVGVLPDESGVVFELTSAHSLYPPASPKPPQEGIFFVRPDGRGLRRLGPATTLPLLTAVADPASPGGLAFSFRENAIFNSSPNSRLITFTDAGPGPDGELAPQIFVLDVESAKRTPLTSVPPATPGVTPVCCPNFVDDRTVTFYNGPLNAAFTVRTDGSRLEPAPGAEAVPGATVVPQFQITGGGGRIRVFRLTGEPRRRYPGLDQIIEVFLQDGKHLLQLTNFGYPDTGYNASAGPDQVFFVASADPLGENPAGMCQVFSVSNLGDGLRQLSRIPDDGLPKHGCVLSAGGSCSHGGLIQDPVTRMVGFISTCDPLQRNAGVTQLFTMRPDGSGLRQITAFRGLETLPDGSIQMETLGPVSYSAVLF
jgi:hypothetical protein